METLKEHGNSKLNIQAKVPDKQQVSEIKEVLKGESGLTGIGVDEYVLELGLKNAQKSAFAGADF